MLTSTGKPKRHADDSLKGKYMVQYIDHRKQLKSLDVQTDWAEINFGIAALAYAQQLAYDLLAYVKFKSNNGSMVEMNCFVTVDSHDVTVMMDNFEINKLKYMPATRVHVGPMYTVDKKTGNCKKIPNHKREYKDVPAKWYGYSFKAKEHIELDENFVNENFSKRLIAQTKTIGINRSCIYAMIPPGRSLCCAEIPENVGQGHPLKYYQNDGDRTCLVISFANLLHHLNCRTHANLLFSQRIKLTERLDIWKLFFEFLEKLSGKLHMQGVILEYKMLLNKWYYYPIITCLEGSDGKRDHTITIYKGWIYDGNFKCALHLSQDALDLCCSEDDQKETFVRFHHSYTFVRFEDYLLNNSEGDIKDNKKEKQKAKKRMHKLRPDKKEKNKFRKRTNISV